MKKTESFSTCMLNMKKQTMTGRGLTATTYFLSTESTESAENFLGVAASTDGMAHEFMIWSIGFSD
jgi:hypothetical protein